MNPMNPMTEQQKKSLQSASTEHGDTTHNGNYSTPAKTCQGGFPSAPISYEKKAPPQLYEEIKSRVNIVEEFQRLGYRLDKLKERGNGSYTCCCPFHGDDTPSFSISEGEGLYHCFACGESGDIITLWEITKGCVDRSSAAWAIADDYGIVISDKMSYLPKQTTTHAKPAIVKPTAVKPAETAQPEAPQPEPAPELSSPVPAKDIETAFAYRPYERIHSYRGGSVKVVWQRDTAGKKRISWYHQDDNGQWIDGAGKIPLYEAGTPKDGIVLVTEGEKDADTVSQMFDGAFAVSLPNGASDAWKPDYLERLKSLGVECAVIFRDNDKPGKQCAERTLKALGESGIACKVIDLTEIWDGMPEKADVSDYVSYRRDSGASTHTIFSELVQLIASTPEILPPKPGPTPQQAISPVKVDDQNPLLPQLRQLDIMSNPRYPLNGWGAGNIFADLFRGNARYCADFNTWMAYNSEYGVWERDNISPRELVKTLSGAVEVLAYEYQDERFTKFSSRFGGRKFREDTLADAQSVYPINAADFDTDGTIINLKNGVLNLDTLDFREHSPEDMLMHCAPVEYNPDARSPLWQTNVIEVLEDPEKLWYVQKLAGLSLTTDNRRSKFDIFLGVTSRNGKSTICDVLSAVLGNANSKIPGYAVSLSPESFSDRKMVNPSAPSPDMMQLMGSRLCIVPEPKKTMVLDAEQIKRLTGGNYISARQLHEKPVNFKFNGHLIFDTNYMPKVTDSTLFKSGRCVIVPFSRTFAENERDETRRERLTTSESLSGVLNWMLGGLKMIHTSGMDIPAVCREAITDIWEDSDPVKRFFEEEFVRCPGGLVSTKAAKERYDTWCANQGLEPWGQKAFLTALKVYAGELGRNRYLGSLARGFLNYVLA